MQARSLNGQRSLLSLRITVATLGEHAKSKKLYEQVISGRTATLGAASSETLMSQNNLANLLDDMGRVDEAREPAASLTRGRL